GSVEFFASWVPKGRVILEVSCARRETGLEALRVAAAAIPLRTEIVESKASSEGVFQPQQRVTPPRCLPFFIRKRLAAVEFKEKLEARKAERAAQKQLEMAANQAAYEFYRQSSIGQSLTDALDEMIEDGSIEPNVAIAMLKQFDNSMAEALRLQVRAKATIKGKLQIYRFCDDVWTFVIDQGANFKFENSELVKADEKVKLVACASRP
ncbi:hypothetical protein HDU99_000108, partial [Rhizoclosmatium hyalinum]